MKRLLLATNNPGKVRELRRLLADVPVEIVTPADIGLSLDPQETGTTYVENATIKARAFAEASGLLALADDSGIEVDALDGRPGVYSARYGGPGLDDAGRTNLMLQDLKGIPVPARTARYRAIVALAEPGGAVHTFEGVQEGAIAFETRGANGFGYDPIFLVDPNRTQAEITDDEKDAISHRAKATHLAAAYLQQQP